LNTEPFLTPYVSGKQVLIQFPATGITDRPDLQFFYDHIKDIPDCGLLDVGANKGYYALLSVIKPDLYYYSFEPNPRIFKRFLLNHLAINHVQDRGRAFNYGLSKEKCTSRIWYDNSLRGSMIKDELKEKEIKEILEKSPKRKGHVRYTSVECDFERFDDVRASVIGDREIHAIKIDVEGAEGWVIEGAREFLSQTKALVFIELIQLYCGKFGITTGGIIDLLKSVGYRHFERFGCNALCKK
jgi:FkbM family methyltransferase